MLIFFVPSTVIEIVIMVEMSLTKFLQMVDIITMKQEQICKNNGFNVVRAWEWEWEWTERKKDIIQDPDDICRKSLQVNMPAVSAMIQSITDL